MSDRTPTRPAHSEGGTTSYDYHKFVHLVPKGYTIPEGAQVRLVTTNDERCEETFFTALTDFQVPSWKSLGYYLDYDTTKPALSTEIHSVIYNVKANGYQYPVAVYQGTQLWSAFNDFGDRKGIFSAEIESFDTTPSTKEGAEQ